MLAVLSHLSWRQLFQNLQLGCSLGLLFCCHLKRPLNHQSECLGFLSFFYMESPRSVLGVYWKDWGWSWNSNTLTTSCEELTHWKRPWCWEGLGAGGKVDDRGWDGWMASPTWWAWVWVNSRSWWWTGRPGVLWFMGSQRVRYNWATELNWTEQMLLNYGVGEDSWESLGLQRDPTSPS